MNQISLMALRPTHPVGWLAALGLHRTTTGAVDNAARLSWTNNATPSAMLHTALTRTELLDGLATVWDQQVEDRAVLTLQVAGQRHAFPPDSPMAPAAARRVTGGKGMNDPAKMLEWEFASRAGAAMDSDVPDSVAWLRSLATDIVLESNRPPSTTSLTSLYLLSRQQTVFRVLQSLWREENASRREWLEAGITAWRRVLPTPAMNWDIGGSKNAAEMPTGSAWSGVDPGSTWLAMMALPYFPVGATRGRSTTRSVQQAGKGRWAPMLVMPCWRPALDRSAVETLLDHPALEVSHDHRLRSSRGVLGALGVIDVYGSEVVSRSVGGQREYYLGESKPLPYREPATRITHRSRTP